MTRLQLVWQSFRHYLRQNLLVVAGVAVSTAVLTGALIIGDSVRFSLEQSTFFRLGKTTQVVAAADRYFRSELAGAVAAETGFPVAPVLLLEGMAVADGGNLRVNRVQVTGVDERFEAIAGDTLLSRLADNEVVISENLAGQLQLKPGDNLMVRIRKASLVPMNAPFVSDAETSVTLRATVKAVAGKEQMGNFNLKNSQTAPFNLFLSLERLNRLMEFEGRANRLLLAAETLSSEQLLAALQKTVQPEDAGLQFKTIPLTGEKEISTERVFLEAAVVKIFEQAPGARKVLTYFVNSLSLGEKETPYSFVSTLSDDELQPGEIVLNQWTASDLGARPGDTLLLRYFEIGPLRQLVEKTVSLRLKEVVPLAGRFADVDLMPHIPGLSDAGHCREWEAGVPVQLDKIRTKDEAYWNHYKGTPKAFVSLAQAERIWSNRFGNYTAIRTDPSFTETAYRQLFAENIRPAEIGLMVNAVREEGLQAARGGVDFSELFLGLSFFLLVAAVVLTALLFRLNLETRTQQIGTFLQLGFRKGQVARLLVAEAAFVAFTGAWAGLLLAVAYTQLVFGFLNTLWWDIVRTSVLFIQLRPATLLTGGLISLLVSMGAVALSLRAHLRKNITALQRVSGSAETRVVKVLKIAGATLLPGFALAILIGQFSAGTTLDPGLFFLSGGMLLPGLLLWAERYFRRGEQGRENHFSLVSLSSRSVAHHRGRSLTVVVLFALGTFLVVSTGANRQDVFAGAGNRAGGTGGFRYFAETSVPVLYDVNDPARRLSEGLPNHFEAVQFHRVEGDDASCLNLNRISNPAILGVDPPALKGRFSFVSRTANLDEADPWQSLSATLPGGVVPAIADQTVIQWGLGMQVGDTLLYQGETGDTLRLKLIGGLAPSIFQGYVIVGNSHFLRYYPTHSGSSLFLVDSEADVAEPVAGELQNIFRDYGWEMSPAAQRLAGFYSVTNTYLSIFLALGALGLALGTVGLAVVLARAILERRRELAILMAVGFSRRKITGLLVREYAGLLATGVIIGFAAAVLATLPAFLSAHTPVSFLSAASVTAFILANGLVWIFLLSLTLVQSRVLVPALRDE